jgi:hypothetical protein
MLLPRKSFQEGIPKRAADTSHRPVEGNPWPWLQQMDLARVTIQGEECKHYTVN